MFGAFEGLRAQGEVNLMLGGVFDEDAVARRRPRLEEGTYDVRQADQERTPKSRLEAVYTRETRRAPETER
jgi:hypothetical protein